MIMLVHVDRSNFPPNKPRFGCLLSIGESTTAVERIVEPRYHASVTNPSFMSAVNSLSFALTVFNTNFKCINPYQVVHHINDINVVIFVIIRSIDSKS